MKNSIKAAAGAMFLIGCGDVGPPEGAKNITDAQYEVIKSDLDRAELQSGFTKELLDRADPILDLKGKLRDNNDHYKDLVDSMNTDGRWYLENDHFVIINPEDVNQAEIDEFAPGFRTENDITDNYILVVHDEKEEFTSKRVGEYMHQFARYYYPMEHVLVTEKAIEKYDPMVGEVLINFFPLDDENRLFGEGGQIDSVEWLAGPYKDMLHIAENKDKDEWRAIYEEDYAEKYSDFESWIEDEVRGDYELLMKNAEMTDEETIELYLEYYSSDKLKMPGTLKAFGVTQQEYADAIRNSPELFIIDQEQLKEMAEHAQTLFPEFDLEKGEGHEVNQEQKNEVEPEGRWRPKRM